MGADPITMAIGATAGLGGSLISGLSKDKKRRQAQRDAHHRAQENARILEEQMARVNTLSGPVINNSLYSQMNARIHDTMYGGEQAALQRIRESMAARGMTRGGMSDDAMLRYRIGRASQAAQQQTQLEQWRTTTNRAGKERYVDMANRTQRLGQDVVDRHMERRANIRMTDPLGDMAQSMGNQLASLAGMAGAQNHQSSMMQQLMAQGGGGYTPINFSQPNYGGYFNAGGSPWGGAGPRQIPGGANFQMPAGGLQAMLGGGF